MIAKHGLHLQLTAERLHVAAQRAHVHVVVVLDFGDRRTSQPQRPSEVGLADFLESLGALAEL